MINKILIKVKNLNVMIIPIYLMFSFVFSDFGISAVFGAIGFFTIAFLFFIINFEEVKRKINSYDKLSFLYLFFILFVFINYIRRLQFDRTIIYYCIILFSTFLLFLSVKKSDVNKVEKALKIFVYFSLFTSILNIFYFIFPTIYENTILMVITESSREYFLRLSSQGYGATIGADIGYTAFSIVIGCIIMYVYKDKIKKRLFYSLFLFELIALFLLQRRSELLSLFIVLISIYLWRKFKDVDAKQFLIKERKKIIVMVLAVFLFIILLVLVTIFLLPNNPSAVDNRFLQTLIEFKTGKDISNGRFALYSIAWEVFKENWLVGVGWGGFSEYVYLSGNTHVLNVHCIYLQILSETGIIGFALFITGIFKLLLLSLKNMKKLRKTSILLVLSILFYIIIMGFLDNILYTPYFLLSFAFCLIVLKTNVKEDGSVSDCIKDKKIKDI